MTGWPARRNRRWSRSCPSVMPITDFWDCRTDRLPSQRYLLHELVADVHCGHNVRSTVFLEARAMYRPDGPEELRPVGEVDFVQGLAAASASGLYGPCRAAAAIVGHANLNLGERVAAVLEALQAASPNRFRGIRHNVMWDPHPAVDSRAQPGTLASPAFRTGAQVLARQGLSFDTFLYFPQLPEVTAFAAAVPDLPIILNHLGGLLRIGPYANQVSALRADFARPSYAWRSSNLALKAILSARVVSWAVPHPRSLQRLGGYRAGDHNARA
ncbi:MAG TPA: amidohydrolase family protein [Candidatus Saccharimonadia bacterium]|nr:amidohydrolase family protein [Candidatus Saccharimonadia bacterium]